MNWDPETSHAPLHFRNFIDPVTGVSGKQNPKESEGIAAVLPDRSIYFCGFDPQEIATFSPNSATH